MVKPSPQQLREQEEKFVHDRLEAILEIKKEVETNSKIVNKQFGDELEFALMHLKKAENFKMSGKNFNALDELEKAKSLARKTLLQIQALSMLKMEDWHTRGKEQTDRIVSLWKVYIEPSFDLASFLCVIHFENHTDGVFCIGSSEDTVTITGIQTSFPKSWIDMVVRHSINLSDIKNHSPSLDGIGYDFQMTSHFIQRIQLEFGNPHTASLIELEKAFIKTAESIVSTETSQEGMNYIVNIWKKYAHG